MQGYEIDSVPVWMRGNKISDPLLIPDALMIPPPSPAAGKLLRLNNSLDMDPSIRPFSCTICPNRFKTRQHLTQHMRLHTGEKPYSCQHCHAKFSQMTPLKRHLVKEHGIECSYNPKVTTFNHST